MHNTFASINVPRLDNSEIILMDVFKMPQKNSTEKSHLVIFSQNYILLFQDQTRNDLKKIFRLDFDTKFGMIKDPQQKVVGIKFERGDSPSFEIFSQSKYLLRGWELQLQKRINKRGFHQEFRPVKKIGKGNFASVYLATRLFDQRKVAVKAFSKEMLQGQQKGIESIINQIKLLRQFNHQNIIKLLAVYESQNSLYLVMEHLEGNLLQSMISKHIFSLNETRNIIKGLLQGISELSQKNVVHRDLKPQNLMFRTSKIDEGIVILDFGLATFCDEQDYIYTRCGTPGYVSPQIVNIKDIANAKCNSISDVFSLGVIFHILLMRRSPFKGRTFNEVLHQNRVCNIDLNVQSYGHLDSEGFELMSLMLEKDPEKRISAKECLNHAFFTNMENSCNSQNNPEALMEKYESQILDLNNIIKHKLQVRNQ